MSLSSACQLWVEAEGVEALCLKLQYLAAESRYSSLCCQQGLSFLHFLVLLIYLALEFDLEVIEMSCREVYHFQRRFAAQDGADSQWTASISLGALPCSLSLFSDFYCLVVSFESLELGSKCVWTGLCHLHCEFVLVPMTMMIRIHRQHFYWMAFWVNQHHLAFEV